MSDKKTKSGGILIRLDDQLEEAVSEYHYAFFQTHGVEVPRAQILLALIRKGLEGQVRADGKVKG